MIEQKTAPRLLPLFAKAVARPRSGGGPLPQTEVVRRAVQVDPDRLAAYARVCGFTLRSTVPATYLHVLTFPLQVALFADRAYPYPMAGSVHLSNTITQHRPVEVGEALRLSVRAQNARTHRRGATADLVGQVQVGSEVVWEGVSTYLYRGARAELAEAPRAQETPAPEGAGARWPLPSNLGRQYAAVAGDLNPIHLNSLAARAMGFPRAIAHGMWSMAAMLAAVENRLPEAYVAQVSFRKPILLPSTVRFVQRPTGQGRGLALALSNAAKGTEHVRGEIVAS